MLIRCRPTPYHMIACSLTLLLLQTISGCGDGRGGKLQEKLLTIDRLQSRLTLAREWMEERDSEDSVDHQKVYQRIVHQKKAYQTALEIVEAHPPEERLQPRPFWAHYNPNVEIGKDVPRRRFSVLWLATDFEVRGIFLRHENKEWEYPIIDSQSEWVQGWRDGCSDWLRQLVIPVLRQNKETIGQYSDLVKLGTSELEVPGFPYVVLPSRVMKYLSGDNGASLEIGLLLEEGGRSMAIPLFLWETE